jgi:hypothetical protein
MSWLLCTLSDIKNFTADFRHEAQTLMVERGPTAAQATRDPRPPGSKLGRDVTLIAVLKIALLAALFALCYRPQSQPAQDAAATAAAVAGTAPAVTTEVQQ